MGESSSGLVPNPMAVLNEGLDRQRREVLLQSGKVEARTSRSNGTGIVQLSVQNSLQNTEVI